MLNLMGSDADAPTCPGDVGGTGIVITGPESCLVRAYLPDGTCTPYTLCGVNASDCEGLLACLKECPPLPP
jgi:hypothetical protein